jgi:Tfp pilus assembly protein PilV
MRRGFILVEVSTAYLVLSLALVTLMPVFILALRVGKNMEQIASASQLSAELLEEIGLRKWDTDTPKPPVYISASKAIGTEPGESPSDKRTFDDIDDFNGWTEPQPLDPVMNPMTDFAAYSRTVTVKFVDSNLNPSAAVTDYKQVTVCTSTKKLKPLCMDTLFTNR